MLLVLPIYVWDPLHIFENSQELVMLQRLVLCFQLPVLNILVSHMVLVELEGLVAELVVLEAASLERFMLVIIIAEA